MFKAPVIYFYKMNRRSFSFTMEEKYREAVAKLNLLQSNAAIIKSPENVKYSDQKLKKAEYYVSKCVADLEILEKDLSIIHVAGTKGKGSTCAYTESILRQFGYKTGFFSSPHLISVRERIRINGEPLSKGDFVRYFWDVYDAIEKCGSKEYPMPTYFVFMTVMAIRVFWLEKVDVAILEVGIGGAFDCTNIFKNVSVVGIASLGFDHMKMLGYTIEEITWQKAGIMKKDAIAVTASEQPDEAMCILASQAAEKQCFLYVAPPLEKYDWNCYSYNKIGLKGPCQHLNVSLAMQLANAWINRDVYKRSAPIIGSAKEGPSFAVNEQISKGLMDCFWPGRTEVIKKNGVTYYLDGAHNLESMQQCARWFYQNVSSSSRITRKILIFNVLGDRDISMLLTLLTPCAFDFACFCPNAVSKKSHTLSSDTADFKMSQIEGAQRCEDCRQEWIRLNYNAEEVAHVFDCVTEALLFAEDMKRNCATNVDVLITGSLHLVGAALAILNPNLQRLNT